MPSEKVNITLIDKERQSVSPKWVMTSLVSRPRLWVEVP